MVKFVNRTSLNDCFPLKRCFVLQMDTDSSDAASAQQNTVEAADITSLDIGLIPQYNNGQVDRQCVFLYFEKKR